MVAAAPPLGAPRNTCGADVYLCSSLGLSRWPLGSLVLASRAAVPGLPFLLCTSTSLHAPYLPDPDPGLEASGHTCSPHVLAPGTGLDMVHVKACWDRALALTGCGPSQGS